MKGDGPRGESARDLLRLLGFLGPFSGKVALSLVLGAGTVVSGAVLLATASYLISAAALGTALVLLTGPVYAVRLSGVARAAFRYAERLFSHDATFHLLSGFRTYLYRRLEPLAPAQLTYRHSGDLLARVTKDVEDLQEVYLRGLAPIAVAALVALATGAFYALFSLTLAAWAVGLLVVAGLGSPALVWSLGRGLARREATLRAELDAHLVDGVQGAQDLLAFGRESDHARTAAVLGGKLACVRRRRGALESFGESLGELAAGGAAFAALLLAAPLILSGEVRGVFLAALVLVALGAFEAVAPLGGALRATGRTLAAARRLFEITDAEPLVREPDSPRALPPGPLPVELRDVHFRYAGAPEGEAALRGVSLRVPAGRTVAVVGPSGSGKSTLAHLLLRFSDPDSGSVLLGGRDLRDLAGEDLRRSVGVCEQSTHVFCGTLRENLLLVRPEATEEELARAVRLAGLDELVERLPGGLDAPVGEQGLKLSGGERQRLALARVFLEDAPVLVLDEVASHLDAEAERALARAVRESARPGRTTVHVTHRLVGLDRMDEVFVLDRGRIVERGTHDELARGEGLYARMLRVQRDLIEAAEAPADAGAALVPAENVQRRRRGD